MEKKSTLKKLIKFKTKSHHIQVYNVQYILQWKVFHMVRWKVHVYKKQVNANYDSYKMIYIHIHEKDALKPNIYKTYQ